MHPSRSRGQGIGLEVGDPLVVAHPGERAQRHPVGLDPVRPRIAAELVAHRARPHVGPRDRAARRVDLGRAVQPT